MISSRQAAGRALGLIGIGVGGFVYAIWQVAHRGVYQYSTSIYPFDDADEWRYTACSRLVEHGYRLFDQVFSAQPPVLFLSLAGGMRIFGDSITGARWTEVLFGVVALIATAWVTWLLAGPIASAIASLVLAVSPGFLVYSRAVEAEIPMMALETLALALVLAYRRYERLPLLGLGGLALAVAILTKLFAVEALIPALWIILRSAPMRGRVLPAILFLVAALIPVGAEMAIVSPANQWAQVVTMHNAAAGIALPGAPSVLHVMREFVLLDAGLSLLALAGIAVLAVLAVWEDAIFLALWLGGTVVMLAVFRPLFPHHPVIMLSAMAASAGVAGTVLVEQVRSRRWLAAAPLGLLAIAYLALLPRLAHADRHSLYPGESPIRTALAAFVEHRAAPQAFVAVDDLAVADLSHRLVPPGLCDPSTVRLRSGYLSAGELESQVERYRARLVLPTLGVYVQVPHFMAWLGRHFRRIPAPAGQHAYVRRG